jgi:hypothetical protein
MILLKIFIKVKHRTKSIKLSIMAYEEKSWLVYGSYQFIASQLQIHPSLPALQ